MMNDLLLMNGYAVYVLSAFSFTLFSLLIFLMKYNTELIKIKNKGLDRL